MLADMFEDAEFEVPWNRMTEAGHQVAVVGLQRAAEVSGKQGARTVVDLAVAEVRPDEFDALVIPGGYRNAGQCSGLQAGGEGPRWEGR